MLACSLPSWHRGKAPIGCLNKYPLMYPLCTVGVRKKMAVVATGTKNTVCSLCTKAL